MYILYKPLMYNKNCFTYMWIKIQIYLNFYFKIIVKIRKIFHKLI